MGSKPITQRAGTKYGSAPANQEVTVDAEGTTPAKFEKMSPLKQVEITDMVNRGDWSPSDSTVGGKRNVKAFPETDPVTGMYREPKVSYSNYYSEFDPTAVMPPEGESAGDVLSNSEPATTREKVSSVTEGVDLVQGARDLGESKIPTAATATAAKPSKVEGSITSGEEEASDDGKFVGAYERRQRMRAVRKTARDRKRGAIKEARLTEGGDVKAARKQAKLDKARDIKAEATRMAGSNVDTYKTKFRGSGQPADASATFRSIGADVANTDFSIKRNSSKPSLTTKTTSDEQKIQNFRSLIGEDDKATQGSGVNKNAKTPLYKMGGYGSKAYKK